MILADGRPGHLDTHFGAWTGRALLREDLFLERLVSLSSEEHFDSVVRAETERQRREQPTPVAAWPRPAYPAATVVSPSDHSEHALDAFAQVVEPRRYAWPGSAVLIDDEEPEPRLLELLVDLNPLSGGAGMLPQ